MSILTHPSTDSILFKTFKVSKKLPKEQYKYVLGVSGKGKISKYIRGNTSHTTKGTIKLNFVINVIDLSEERENLSYKAYEVSF
ncbi:hypothetical protein [Winogradskyella ursingii]|uniref:hypothetical protein n=1 Tax=Winogradskyella ursingii TaxID=2686079 RepID=UPI0015C89098|nr:hypothetical protein [Winogradskyella ursingii]